MDGVLEATIILFGCKVVCSVVCLPAFRCSISSVSLCCSCLLLFTDVSITVFLTYLWCGASSLSSFQPSSDTIALRFGLFLGDTYGAVLVLTPPLVAVEVLTHLLWLREQEKTVAGLDRQGAMEEKGGVSRPVPSLGVYGETWEMGAQSGRGLKALGFLGCLLLWSVCGTHAGLSWRQEQPTVTTCLEGGGSLFTCLPCLLTASSPVTEDIAWVLTSTALLLGLLPGLGLLAARLLRASAQPADGGYTQHLRQTDPAAALSLGQAECLVLVQPPRSTHRAVDWEKTADTCADGTSQPGHSNRRRPSGSPVPAPGRTASADGCRLKSESPSLAPPMPSELPVAGEETMSSTVQAPPPCERCAWQPQRESPDKRGGLMTGLACAFLVLICPTVLSTNIALISCLDTLAVYVVQQLLLPPQHT